ncbi:hypothetical protein LY474_32300 [Myxococcus stipitatus]|uniref:hypothetical protein n=1 Tax=Myxococcus stipitatus TaxID=83455 RepID=UPI001F2BBA49|nr:hypothetical protein [Myxococcus stipitatus]MCE9672499.1 hypothetical protein [Myxococcus stipitatus]
MAGTAWKWPALLGLGLAVLSGCGERNDKSLAENSREVGRQVGKATKDLKEGARDAARDARSAAHEASEGFKEGSGGSGREGQTPPPPPPPADARPHDERPAGKPADTTR